MNRARMYYSIGLSLLGVTILIGSWFVAMTKGIGFEALFLVTLGIATGWLRLALEPTGYITMSPVVVFVSLLLAEPHVTLVIAVTSSFASSRIFGHRSWPDVMLDICDEGAAALVAILIASLAPSVTARIGTDGLWSYYFAALLGYALTRLSFGLLKAKMEEGVGVRSFVSGSGRSMLINLAIFGAVASGFAYLTWSFGNAGYFVLALATIALVEFYHPYKLLSEQRGILFASLAMIAHAIDLKDPYTASHSGNVADIAVRLARVMGLHESEVRKIRTGALLHDIGKVGVSGSIIRKPGHLEPDETLTMRQHPIISADIMQPVELLSDAADLVRHHHEHFDGTGYPDGLVGDEIPIGSRVILVADAFDAMTSDRPYRLGRSKSDAIRVMKEHSGRQFDPTVVEALELVIQIV